MKEHETVTANNNRHEQLGLTDGQVLDMYKYMVLARKFDERNLLLQRAGKINFHVSGIGQEACQVAAAFALDREKDYFLPYYRDYGFVMAVGMTPRELMLSAFAKAEDPNSGGRQMPGHFGSKRLRIVTGSSPVTTQVPHAVGIALAAKMQKKDFVSFVTFGEGSSNQGDFHEGCNFAGVHKLPVIIMCENNQYAISVPLHKQISGKVSDRALGYGFPGIRVDGNDALEVYAAVKEARERAIRGEGPTLIESMMYRLSPHSTSDNDLAYRTKEEVEENWKKDGVARFKTYLIDLGLWDETRDQDLVAQLNLEIKEATESADLAPFPKPEDTLLHVYADDEGGAAEWR
ncbi:3-methyl-2-oxobutanoate dehydrogenase (2-methylpropanoyl-transferring) [Paenibacillus vortex V453]|jgi:2-oxoisovalerate dehydrogenase E1 component alpha subunit|uniref:2-oxoisovalerate dehydrogenase subunit alpha n=1 Tax=Paenibacillus vortex V453 TaxID=715225 RepID=A0A2R9SW60_9BACL|nr:MULTISPECIES: thiamine pyrophosphate-dependent dehydrogenase E1 component subunit alpha [Paenibacillus]ANA81970.1 2-oxoisovalerate dehydrogenase [Paenibacillus glucanolyticus]AVV59296.1 thiamine pyrophosphate-dependent dehydrogenase E1 component subunit alpha [Paenibacillus glucanolyticus]AWP28467.1 2-oxoisovalerate dehydrogenase [Paenibacillus sp. Cedars]EFU41584.1 3-methyl-2-oxobutanoate dehydrogenase (2-methylpropanoyl-transferring) [Paenibacillus vortex V453]ETT43400.1 3-methyl-2-oxobut